MSIPSNPCRYQQRADPGLEKYERVVDAYIAKIRSLGGKEVDLAKPTHILAFDTLS
jgi:hypothetical protein